MAKEVSLPDFVLMFAVSPPTDLLPEASLVEDHAYQSARDCLLKKIKPVYEANEGSSNDIDYAISVVYSIIKKELEVRPPSSYIVPQHRLFEIFTYLTIANCPFSSIIVRRIFKPHPFCGIVECLRVMSCSTSRPLH